MPVRCKQQISHANHPSDLHVNITQESQQMICDQPSLSMNAKLKHPEFSERVHASSNMCGGIMLRKCQA